MQDQAEMVRGLYDAFAKGDVPTVLGAFAPDIVWNEAEGFVYADGNPYIGPQAVLDGVLIRLATEWEGVSIVPEEFIASGDTVVAQGRYRGKHKVTGRSVNAQFAHVWKLRNGQVVAFQQYTDTAQFRDAAAKAAGA
jgi:ketosteroid isomerase-like protein